MIILYYNGFCIINLKYLKHTNGYELTYSSIKNLRCLEEVLNP